MRSSICPDTVASAKAIASSFLFIVALFFSLTPIADANVPLRAPAPASTFDEGIVQVERFAAPGKHALIFIPALACGPWEWNGQIAALAGRYDIYVVRLPGFDGLRALSGDALVSRTAASIARLVRTRKLSHPIVVGHSIGGSLTIYFAEHYPELLGGAIAIEGGYPIGSTEQARRRAAAEDVAPFRGNSREKFERTFKTVMLNDMLQSKADVDTVARMAARSDPNAVAAWLYDVDMLDLTPGLSKVHAPIVEIVPFDASVDASYGLTLAKKRSLYERWLARAPRSSVVMIDRARHFVMFDRPAAFDRALFAAIDRMTGARP